MKKIIGLLVLALCVFVGLELKAAKIDSEIANNKIYFFYSDYCPHCHHAQDYINKKYPDLQMEKINVQTPDGYKLLFKAAKKYNLGQMVGTPLFAFGDDYMMGWSEAYEKKFDTLVKPYLK